MKLYDLQRGSFFRLLNPSPVPPDAPAAITGTTYKLHNIDGMFSYCTDEGGLVYHVAAYAEVVIVDGFGNS